SGYRTALPLGWRRCSIQLLTRSMRSIVGGRVEAPMTDRSVSPAGGGVWQAGAERVSEIPRAVREAPPGAENRYHDNTHDAPRGAEKPSAFGPPGRSEEHTSELQSRSDLVCRLLLEKKKDTQ